MSVAEKNIHDKHSDGAIEIRLSDILNFLQKNWKVALASSIIGAVIGGILSFSKPNEYTSQVTVLPEVSSKNSMNLGNLGSLAGLAGIDVNGMKGNSDAIGPELYPNIVQSMTFCLSLLAQPVYINSINKFQNFETYLRENSRPGILSKLFASGSSDSSVNYVKNNNRPIRISQEQEEFTKIINERLVAFYDKKTGILTITSTMNDPIVSADVANHALTYLTNYITSYRTEKARREVEFLNQQVFTSKQRYQRAEYNLSEYRDRNRSVFLNTAKIEEQRIQADFILAQDLYNTLSKQAEMAKIKVQEETPVFKVLEPARIPTKKSGPKRINYILGFGFLGALVGLIILFFKQ